MPLGSVAAFPPYPAEPAARRAQVPAASGWPTLTGLRNLDMDAPAARPLALALGGALGGMVGLVANAISPLPSLLLGALLGETSLLLSRVEREQHLQRVKLLQTYPALRELAEQRGVRYDDRDQVRRIHDVLQARMSDMVARYRQHCQLRNLPWSEVLDNVIKAFYLSHCKDCAPAVITCVETGQRLLAAVPSAEVPVIEHAVHVENRAPDAVLRQLGRVFLRMDLIGNTLRDARAFRVQRQDGEWKVTATTTPDAMPLVDCYAPSAEPMVRLRRQPRSTRLPVGHATADGPHARPTATPVTGPVYRVEMGQTMARQLERLSSNSVTRLGIQQLQSDLQQGRRRGHLVQCGGQSYNSVDAKMDGVRGRGVWRVLYQRQGDTFTLLGIGDYHHRRCAPITWW